MLRFFKTPYLFRKIFSKRIWGFSCPENSVYLTFDDGPHPLITPWVLDFLKEEGIKATFFCVGDNVRKYNEIFQQIISDGHEVGNHTMYHTNAVKTDKKTYFSSLEEATNFISSNLLRPPYGRLPLFWETEIRRKFKIIMWTWLSYDFDPKISIDKIIKRAKKIKSGDILVLHDNPKIAEKQKKLLPELISYLKENNFTFKVIQNDESLKN